MRYKSSIKIRNSSRNIKQLFLEPWGEAFEIPSGKTFEFVGTSAKNGNFEVEFTEDEIIVFAWVGSNVKVYCEDKELGGSHRPSVPAVPKGQSVSSFLGLMFGKKDN
jgi:hypothetical protein